VPVISTFFGIVVRMFYQDHDPPHFHAEYQGQHGKFDFAGCLIVGEIRSRNAKALIRKWVLLHADDLEANWERMKAGERLERVEPLE